VGSSWFPRQLAMGGKPRAPTLPANGRKGIFAPVLRVRRGVSAENRHHAGRNSMRLRASLLSLCLFAVTADAALAAGPYAFVTGRRDPRIYAIDLSAALKPANNNTDKAIISRNLVGPRRLDGMILGDPANIVLSQDGKTAFVMNHHGQVSNSEFLQHGGRASVSIMDVKKMLQKSSDNSDAAVEKVIDGGWFGGVGVLPLNNPNLLLTSASEGWLSEDGSN